VSAILGIVVLTQAGIQMAIKIHIADDHAMFRTGLVALIEKEDDMVVVGETGNAFDTLRWLQENEADVLILDINMPGPPVSTLVNEIAENKWGVAVLIVTIHDEEYYLREFFKLGAKGFMVKTSTSTELIEAIRNVNQGREYIDPTMSKYMISNYLGRPVKSGMPVEALTKREQEVCALLARGYTNSEAASSLNISKRTVETHRASIMAKLELKSRAELVKFAMDNGLLHR
jgi:DNA-binding NarL/FixJ family response regulator